MKIVLTFDIERDIPNFLDTDFGLKVGIIKILNLLDEFQIKATFFCSGNIVKGHSSVINVIENKGHELACHGLNHERLNQLNFEDNKEIILKSKSILEEICKNSDIIGFRAPYLKAPPYIFELLSDLEFKYDSSIKPKRAKFYKINSFKIQEFHPLSLYSFFRMPFSFFFIRKWIFKQELSVLYFHSWEAISIKQLLAKQKFRFKFITTYLFRPDRWINTGDHFILRLRKFIEEGISKNAEFNTLRDLINFRQT